MPGIGAEDERRRAVRIHVVRAVLRVIFDHKDRRLRPELRVADRFDELAQREVVVADIRRSACAARRSCRAYDRWGAGGFAGGACHLWLEAFQLGDETRGSFYVRVV